MRTIRNKTTRPVKVPLPQGKVLHLGPRKEGQIASHDVDHPPLKKLLESGDVEILGEGSAQGSGPSSEEGHVDVHGHHPQNTVKKRGNR